MNTPICDYVNRYAGSDALRVHMPGHKGVRFLGLEHLDITEFDGADDLYHPAGIIRESEENASRLFGCRTLYSTEGSSQCIRAMLYLAVLQAKRQGKRPLIAAGRNVHKTFLSAAALLDFDLDWLCGGTSYLSCDLDAAQLDEMLSKAKDKPTAVYLTSPDYLGNVADIRAIAETVHRHGVLLLVDNAHGAYLRFLPQSRHPMDLGADLCCDSAHKTLPVLTGGAYLHISENAPALFSAEAKNALAMFGSTSPSYLILQSLDRANAYLAEGYRQRLTDFIREVEELKGRLKEHGYCLGGDEPLKLTLFTKPYGYEGQAFAQILLKKNIVCEFYDPDFVVMMLTPETGGEGISRLEAAMNAVPRKPALLTRPPEFHLPERVMSVREAAFAPRETVPVSESVGKVLAFAAVGCPPAVPIVSCGERIDEGTAECFSYYGIGECSVIINERQTYGMVRNDIANMRTEADRRIEPFRQPNIPSGKPMSHI